MFKLIICMFLSLFSNISIFAANPVILTEIAEPLQITDSVTPLFEDKQSYLKDAPQGVGARTAWELPGGRGQNVRIIDIETGMNENHDDLIPFYLGAVPKDSNHGTAVMGILGATDNGFGVTGIASGAQIGFYGFIEGDQADVDEAYLTGINNAISTSVAQLSAGDIIVIEQQMAGPIPNEWTAVEYWPEIFNELKAATDRGIHCVAAAGNGNSNLDNPKYNGAFDLNIRDSGCIMVGAGDKRTKERLYFSNYGSRIDAHGYGFKVVTTGYGDLFNGGNNGIYTKKFSGTSSATPIVAGAVAVVSSIAKERGITITPKQMRAALRATGTPQGSSTINKRIGNLPNIQALIENLNLDREVDTVVKIDSVAKAEPTKEVRKKGKFRSFLRKFFKRN